jgi:hypothetical protein
VLGEKVTSRVQLAPLATLDPQEDFTWYSRFTEIEEMLSALEPLLVRVIVCGELVVPTS